MATISRRASKTPAVPTSDTTPDSTAAQAPPDVATSTDTRPEAPVSGAPSGTSSDHLKIAIVAGVLGDHPDGAPAATIVDESGLRAAIVGRVLTAMEAARAAVRKDATPDAPEFWVRGEADIAGITLVVAPVWHECTCGHRHKAPSPTISTRRVSTAPGHNGNGQATLGKNELRTIVRDFLRAHPDHVFTPTDLSKELGRSSGAIGNACAKLVISGEALLVNEAPAKYAAAPVPADR